MTDYGFKLVFLGDEGVGKSSLIVRYVKNTFSNKYISTLGVDFLTKELKFDEVGLVKLIIWDIGGQETWKKKLNLYLKGSDGAVIVVDLTRKQTLDDLKFWFGALEKYAPNIPRILVGNKTDLNNQRKISSDDLNNKSTIKKFETSAKTGDTVEKIFIEISEMMVENTIKK
ncbi:MAG: GTP-binding protein [Candidatus Lokiarchaeota archaeon]|nr:GTP-binding protein [Candidatus Lokiarchaeota archaeon]